MSNIINKAEMVEALSLQEDFESKASAKRTVEFLIDYIKTNVAKGKEIHVSGLGKFYSTIQAPRSGVNALTGKPFSTDAKKVPKFKAAAQFKKAVK